MFSNKKQHQKKRHSDSYISYFPFLSTPHGIILQYWILRHTAHTGFDCISVLKFEFVSNVIGSGKIFTFDNCPLLLVQKQQLGWVGEIEKDWPGQTRASACSNQSLKWVNPLTQNHYLTNELTEWRSVEQGETGWQVKFYLQFTVQRLLSSSPVGRGEHFHQGDSSRVRFPILSYLMLFRSRPLPCSGSLSALPHDG